jgi:hypothetical protein
MLPFNAGIVILVHLGRADLVVVHQGIGIMGRWRLEIDG